MNFFNNYFSLMAGVLISFVIIVDVALVLLTMVVITEIDPLNRTADLSFKSFNTSVFSEKES